MALAQCMGQAILDGNIQKKTFGDSYFIANQVKFRGKT